MTWPTATLDELCEINVGRTPARANPEYWGDGSPWLSIADMNQGREITQTKEQITAAGAAGGREVAPGTVLLSFKLSIGKVSRSAIPLYTNEAIAALPIKHTNLITEEFLMRALERADLSGGSNRAAMGATLNKAMLREVAIPLPSLPEQRRIAAILDHADALRAKRRQVLAHLDAIPQSIFHDMFTSGDLEWVKAGTLMPNMRNGLSPATAGHHRAEVLTLSAVTQGSFDPLAVKVGLFAIRPPEDKRVTSRDFLICRGNGNKALVGTGTYSQEDRPDLVFPDTVIAGTVDTTLMLLPFLEAAWKRREVRAQVEALARTTNGTFKVNQKTLSTVSVPTPPLDLQAVFANRIANVARERAITQRALAADDELFASLQSRAFRGEL